MRLEGKVATVTGAASGLGEAIARRFAADGARVALQDLDGEGIGRVASEIAHRGGQAIEIVGDVSISADAYSLVEAAVTEFGKLDIVVNCAGVVSSVSDVHHATEDVFHRLFDINVKGIYLSAVHAVPELQNAGGGAIINIGSSGAIRPQAGMGLYNATKAAVNTLSKSMALELAPFNIRVNVINPSGTRTKMFLSFVDDDAEALRLYLEGIPLGRIGEPNDVASAALFLASDEATYITGVSLSVDGGKCI